MRGVVEINQAAANPFAESPPFRLKSDFTPSGDQPEAIKNLCAGLEEGLTDQVLLGVTGSGKTFTMAQVIQEMQRPAIIMAPNKTLAAQLYGEFKSFFRIMRSNILSLITIIISPKPTCRARTPSLKKILRSTNR